MLITLSAILFSFDKQIGFIKLQLLRFLKIIAANTFTNVRNSDNITYINKL